MSGAVSLAIGAVIVGVLTVLATLLYLMMAASRVEQNARPYADQDTFSDEP